MKLRLAASLFFAMASANGAVAVFAEQATQSLSPKAIEALELVSSDDRYKQQMGFLRLEALREPASVSAILPYVSSKNPDLRTESLRAVAAIQGAEAIDLLLDKMQHDPQPRVRRAAILGIEPFAEADPKILPALIAALRDRDTTVRMAAVDVVSRIHEPTAREAILQRYKREGRRDVRRVLEAAIQRVGSKEE